MSKLSFPSYSQPLCKGSFKCTGYRLLSKAVVLFFSLFFLLSFFSFLSSSSGIPSTFVIICVAVPKSLNTIFFFLQSLFSLFWVFKVSIHNMLQCRLFSPPQCILSTNELNKGLLHFSYSSFYFFNLQHSFLILSFSECLSL